MDLDKEEEEEKMLNASPSRIVHSYHQYRELYKSPHSIADVRKTSSDTDLIEPMSWRKAFKQRCIEETKKSRQKLLNKFRNLQVTLFNFESSLLVCVIINDGFIKN